MESASAILGLVSIAKQLFDLSHQYVKASETLLEISRDSSQLGKQVESLEAVLRDIPGLSPTDTANELNDAIIACRSCCEQLAVSCRRYMQAKSKSENKYGATLSRRLSRILPRSASQSGRKQVLHRTAELRDQETQLRAAIDKFLRDKPTAANTLAPNAKERPARDSRPSMHPRFNSIPEMLAASQYSPGHDTPIHQATGYQNLVLEPLNYGKSEGPWARHRLLCLEGADVQGMASLYVLQDLMRRIAVIEQVGQPGREFCAQTSASSPLYLLRSARNDYSATAPSKDQTLYEFRPCHYFDYISGMGIGGLAAVMLGTMRFSVPEVIETIDRVLGSLKLDLFHFSVQTSRFSLSRHKKPQQMRRQEEWLRGMQERTLQNELVQSVSPGKNQDSSSSSDSNDSRGATLRADSDSCQTICLTALEVEKGAHQIGVLRSYQRGSHSSSRNFSSKMNTSIPDWDWTPDMSVVNACMATVALPTYVSSVKLNGVAGCFKSATALDECPAWRAYEEVMMRSTDGQEPEIECLVSIGTGTAPQASQYLSTNRARCNRKLERRLAKRFALFELPSNHPDRRSTASTLGSDSIRVRPNNDGEEPADIAKRFCVDNDENLQKCAESLVDARRVRALTAEWSRFAGLKTTRNSWTPIHAHSAGKSPRREDTSNGNMSATA